MSSHEKLVHYRLLSIGLCADNMSHKYLTEYIYPLTRAGASLSEAILMYVQVLYIVYIVYYEKIK